MLFLQQLTLYCIVSCKVRGNRRNGMLEHKEPFSVWSEFPSTAFLESDIYIAEYMLPSTYLKDEKDCDELNGKSFI